MNVRECLTRGSLSDMDDEGVLAYAIKLHYARTRRETGIGVQARRDMSSVTRSTAHPDRYVRLNNVNGHLATYVDRGEGKLDRVYLDD